MLVLVSLYNSGSISGNVHFLTTEIFSGGDQVEVRNAKERFKSASFQSYYRKEQVSLLEVLE